MKQKLDCLIRIETNKNYAEYGKPLLIFPYERANYLMVNYCAAYGHGEGDYDTMIQNSRPITHEEFAKFAENGTIYGYDVIKELHIIKRVNRKKIIKMWWQ